MAAANTNTDDNSTMLLKKLVENLRLSAVGAGASASDAQSVTSDDNETTLLRKAVTNSYLLAINLP